MSDYTDEEFERDITMLLLTCDGDEDIVAFEAAYDRIITDRNALKAEVERLTKERDLAEKWGAAEARRRIAAEKVAEAANAAMRTGCDDDYAALHAALAEWEATR